MGLDKGVQRFGARYWPEDPAGLKGVLWQSIGMTMASGLLFGLALYFWAPAIAFELFSKPDLTVVIRYFAVFLILIAGLRVSAAASRVTQLMHYGMLAERIAQPAVNLLLIFLLVKFSDYGLHGALLAVGLSYFVGLAYGLIQLSRIYHESFSLKLRQPFLVFQLLLFSLPASMAGMLVKINAWLDRLFIGYFLPSEAAGIYTAASQISNLLLIMSAIFGTMFIPMAAKLFVQGDHDRLNNLYRVSTKWGLYAGLAFFLAVAFVTRDVMHLAYGMDYTAGAPAILILLAAHLIMIAPGNVGLLLIITGHQNRWLVLSAITVLINVILNYLLIPIFGISGAALATGFSMGSLMIGGLWQVKTCLKMWPYDRRYLKGIIAAAASTLVLILWRAVLSPAPILSLITTAVLGSVVFIGILMMLGLDREDVEVIQKIRNRLPWK